MKLTKEYVQEVLDYDPDTGIFTWRVNRKNKKARIGLRAGSIDRSTGYRKIGLCGKWYKEHRLVFLYIVGVMPEQVDHLNGKPDDNRWDNLRPTDNAGNQHNRAKKQPNSSGYLGVYFDKQTRKYRAVITVGDRKVHLGRFATPEEAHAAYVRAKPIWHPDHPILTR